MRTWALAVTAAAMISTGCLGNHYVIPKRDLVALSQTPPEQRGQQVRIIQGFATDDGPPPAPEVHAGAIVVVDTSPGVGPAPRRGSAIHTSSGGRKPFRGNLAKAKADDSKAWIVIAGLAAFGLAVTEGARYDGWVRLHPMHPVHIYGPYGEYTWVPLAQLDPETARWARKAYVRDSEGPWAPLGRAPLDRVGLSYSFYLGAGEFESADQSDNTGFMSHIQFGVFPAQELGVQLDIGLGWTDNQSGNTIFDSRYALELDVLPVSAQRLHAGVFGQGGMSARFEDGFDGEDKTSPFFGGGALLQLEITTRLALSARAGMSHLYGDWVSDFGLGLSIY